MAPVRRLAGAADAFHLFGFLYIRVCGCLYVVLEFWADTFLCSELSGSGLFPRATTYGRIR